MPYKDKDKQKAAQAKWYRDNHTELRMKMNERQRQRRNMIARYLEQYKIDHSTCADCGLDYPPHILDFDHLRDKVSDISKMKRSHSLEDVQAEIEKCEVVCSNCHRHRTWLRSVKVT